jgi:hypothetical protein
VNLRWDERLLLAMYQIGMNVFVPPVVLAISPFLLIKRKRRATLLPRLGFQRFPQPSLQGAGRREGAGKFCGFTPSRSARCSPRFP